MTTSDPCQQLLYDIEAHHGAFRLDRGDFIAEHHDPDWDTAVFGEHPINPLGSIPKIGMFDLSIKLLCQASVLLRPERDNVISRLTVGWTSIPIMNACAVRRGTAMAIAVNRRLHNVLLSANSFYYKLLKAVIDNDRDAMREDASAIRRIVTSGNTLDLDEVMSDLRPFAEDGAFRFAIRLTEPQMLFILLHEFAHVILGHLDSVDLWGWHPIAMESVDFFSGSQSCELQADSLAVSSLFNPQKWLQVRQELPGAPCELFDETNLTPWLMPALIVFLFACFHLMGPYEYDSYYKIPRSHPHPLDRISNVIDCISQLSFFDMKFTRKISDYLVGNFF